MGQDRKLTNEKLSKIWESDEVPVLETSEEKYVIISDIHIGNGSKADDFRNNVGVLKNALDHYNNNGFKLILLGDIEELWQFDIDQIVREYEDSIYKTIRKFSKNRIFRVCGNHDLDWALHDPIEENNSEKSRAVEALKMKDKAGNVSMLLIHGHQGSTDADKSSWLSRIFIKKVWKPVEPIAVKLGLHGHPSATKSQIAKNYEKILYAWAKENKVILICGHSHRAIYASKSYIDKLKEQIRDLQLAIKQHLDDKARVNKIIKEIGQVNLKLAAEMRKGREIDPAGGRTPKPCFFNTGCAMYKDGITVIEIEEDKIRLVKWHKKPEGTELFAVYEDGNGQTLSDFIQALRV